ncbi:MAG TPA: bifunctional 4-hydroxy-2-oxoglutarate aldolase/2-dehydro-3-deoxy-phosphogluconate aldolase [Clostridia bacterium]|nr:bifunctional 4-hydroxy-2-oxoglutarate aldolase/2-dehydro-3-deoxy-phosphogluconate aldolase [Clostridia bacterium]
MNEVLRKISGIGIIPVIKIEEISDAVPLAKALINGGIPIAEITFRAAGAEKAIRAIKEACPEMTVGAGTVLNVDQVKAAVEAGVQFVVSPGFSPKTVDYCNQIGVPVIPGCATASEIGQAIESGLEAVKFFPAEQSGGLDKIKALAGPFGNLQFIPTGGIDLKNLAAYLSFGKVMACGGSFMAKEDFIKNKEWDKITALSKQAVDIILGFEIGHVGINISSEEEALTAASRFGSLFNLPVKNGSSSIFAGSAVEFMKSPYLGRNGHIGIKTNSVFRAKCHLENRGIRFNEESAKFDAEGKLTAIYIDQETGGFAVHLMQK